MLIVNNIIWFVVTGRAVVLVVGGAVDAARCCCCCYSFVSVIVVVVVYRFNIALFLRSRADSLQLACDSTEVISFLKLIFEYPPKSCTYGADMACAT